jgi:phage gp36-like protein
MYATKADIMEQLPEAELIGLTDDAGVGAVDDAIVDRSIADADATVDAYCQDRYPVPFASVPAIIRSISVDLAIYNLYSRRAVAEVPEVRKDRRKDALRFLEKVAEGKIKLGATDQTPVASGNSVAVVAPDRVFTRESLEDY